MCIASFGKALGRGVREQQVGMKEKSRPRFWKVYWIFGSDAEKEFQCWSKVEMAG
jgi:hypothetical protein